MESRSIASRAEVEALKKLWITNPTFDLSAITNPHIGPRFSPFIEELKAFQEENELGWARQAALLQHQNTGAVDTETVGDTIDNSYRRVLAEEALNRYVQLVLPGFPELVRDDLAELISTLVETAVLFTLAGWIDQPVDPLSPGEASFETG